MHHRLSVRRAAQTVSHSRRAAAATLDTVQRCALVACARHFHSGSRSALRRSCAVRVQDSAAAVAAAPHFSPLVCSRATAKSRSLSPDDPFGEKSSWEDPSDGLYSAWKDVDQEGFVNATQSAEVRNAHFGPEWARFTTVGRLSVKKMKEEQAIKPPSTPGDTGSSAGAAQAAAAGAAAAERAKQYPTAEDAHEAQLRAKRRLLERNYMSYEAFVEHELGAGEGFADATAETTDGQPAEEGEVLYSAASMESAFSAVEGVDGRDRMAQRNVEREALDSIEAAEVEEAVPLPNFMLEQDTPHPQADRHAGTAPVSQGAAESVAASSDPSAASAPAAPPSSAPSPAAAVPTAISRPASTPESGSSAGSGSSSAIPASVVQQVLAALGSPHGDAALPLTDPLHWNTEEVLHYLTVMEQPPADVGVSDDANAAATPRDEWSTMDETMCDTFRMARVTGDTLLNVVVPPRLFRLMRRWHVRRQDVVNKAWRQYQEQVATSAAGSPLLERAEGLAPRLPDAVVAAAVAQSREKLDEAVQPLDRILIQETILLCFPYGH